MRADLYACEVRGIQVESQADENAGAHAGRIVKSNAYDGRVGDLQHQHLLRQGLRTRVGLAAEAGDAWDVHHFAALIGYGAEAVHPWLALASVRARLTPQARTGFRTAAEKAAKPWIDAIKEARESRS